MLGINKHKIIGFLFTFILLRFWYKWLQPDIKENKFMKTLCNERDLNCYGLSSRIKGNRIKSKPKELLWVERQSAVVEAFKFAWHSYYNNSFGYDEFYPKLKQGQNFVEGGMGFTIVDSMDTMILMGLEEEYNTCLEWVNNMLSFDKNEFVNVFETNIRVLGGLLSSYFLTGSNNEILLNKSVDLANRLLYAFNTTSGIPEPTINLKTGQNENEIFCSTAEATTLQLEFKYLSYLTNDTSYWNVSDKVIDIVDQQYKLDGLVPIYLNTLNGKLDGSEIRLGSRGDSYYEYLLKLWLQSNKMESKYKRMYDLSVYGIKKWLIGYTIPNKYLIIGEIDSNNPKELIPKMDHLVCFMAGNLVLGATEANINYNNLSTWDKEDFNIGEQLLETCYFTYTMNPTGLAAEITMFNVNDHTNNLDAYIKLNDRHNLLRPETIESIFILYRVTKNEKYREYGWNLFNNFLKYTKIEEGFVSIKDVTTIPPILGDKMETFFLAETLKYFYLLFSNHDFLPLDKIVFNTEAHPFPVFNSKFNN